ncbi:hypothetical protein [Litorihabitans aurantiacus]|uniref:Uncharacterized protein n=1 Tax=Litorihabitans aurantiacus TaxID=1930061 RepID=A0AA37UMG7_9MICO|nr:hypothetical protein [Litorihabitans aurantiacus]GMA31195.1 hypothetical protein GCM10025875_11870 [Litorihabitans aurantiacus]
MEHVIAFVVITLATVLLTRLFLLATGFPQVGGDGLHIAHVLWGGALMIVALVMLLLFIGPVVRPAAVLVGGIGNGLFIDEVGKFLTDDNDYFYEPAFAIIYATSVLIVVAADLVVSRRRRVATEDVASAADVAVTGLVGGLSPRQRAAAHELLERAASSATSGRHVAGADEVRALIDAIPSDDDELPDPIRALTHRVSAAARRLVSETHGWRIALWGSAAVLLGSTVVAITDVPAALDSGVAFLIPVSGLSLLAAWALWFLAWRTQRSGGDGSDDAGGRVRRRALDLLRAAIAVNLLLTQVALFRFDPWQATVLVILGLVLLVVLWAEQQRRHEPAPGDVERMPTA